VTEEPDPDPTPEEPWEPSEYRYEPPWLLEALFGWSPIIGVPVAVLAVYWLWLWLAH
jgi:hypothetical protein